jgi:hypothetical protein
LVLNPAMGVSADNFGHFKKFCVFGKKIASISILCQPYHLNISDKPFKHWISFTEYCSCAIHLMDIQFRKEKLFKEKKIGDTGGSVALTGFQFNDDFAEVTRAPHESIGFFHLIKLENAVYNRMNFICF